MKVTYLDHSGFAVELPGVVLVFDYCHDPSHALHHILERKSQAQVVFFVSHAHEDHFNHSIFETAQNHKRVYVLSNDVPAKDIPSTLDVAGMSAGDTVDTLPGGISVKAYPSTDEGVSFMVTLADGKKIFHGGDLNLWIWKDESDAREIQKAETEFVKALNRISSENPSVDIAMFAVDPRQGTDFGAGAQRFLEAVKTANFFPMHFWGKPDEVSVFVNNLPQELTTVHFLRTPGKSVELS